MCGGGKDWGMLEYVNSLFRSLGTWRAKLFVLSGLDSRGKYWHRTYCGTGPQV